MSDHVHGPNCGHTAIKHKGHTDYLVDGVLEHPTSAGVEKHVLAVSETNPAACTSSQPCAGHDSDHVHGPGCGHEAIQHGDHIDYIVDGRLHHPHGDHCDDHGPVQVVAP